jgi:hypothetical protein
MPFAICGTAWAHHSGAMFDDKLRTKLTGTVKQFQWSNPHAYIQIRVKTATGAEEEWSVEMAAPMYLYRLGWRPGSLKAGDSVTVVVAPLRSGAKGGLLMEARGPDGKLIGKKP